MFNNNEKNPSFEWIDRIDQNWVQEKIHNIIYQKSISPKQKINNLIQIAKDGWNLKWLKQGGLLYIQIASILEAAPMRTLSENVLDLLLDNDLEDLSFKYNNRFKE